MLFKTFIKLYNFFDFKNPEKLTKTDTFFQINPHHALFKHKQC